MTARTQVRLTGNLRIERRGVSRLMYLDVDLRRNPSCLLRGVPGRSVVMSESSFFVNRLRLSPFVKATLVLSGVQTLADIPKSAQGLKRIGLNSAGIQSVLDELRILGYSRQEGGLVLRQPSSDLSCIGEGWLLDSFLDQSLRVLGLSPRIVLRLVGGGVKTVRNLCARMAFEFLHRPFELTSEEVSEVEARLHYFGFELRSGEGAKLRAFQSRWEKLQKEIKTRASNTLTLAEARIFHGSDEFDLWNGFREARTLRGRIAWRNAIVVRHLDKIRKGAACAVPLMQRSQDPSMDFEDLFQEGCIGAMWATGTYDITSRCKPGNYLWFGARLTALRFADRVAGNPHVFRKLKIALERLAMKGFIEPTLEDVAREMRISLGRAEQLLMMIGRGLDRHPVSLDVVEAEDPSWDDCLDLLEEYSERDHNLALKTFVQEMLAEASLLPAEREVVEWRFGLRDGQEYTLEAIAEKYGFIRAPHDVSHWPKMRIWRLLTAALQKLRVVASWRRAKTFVSGLRSPDHPITSDTKGGNSH